MRRLMQFACIALMGACTPREVIFTALDEAAIRQVLAKQQESWNAFALEDFMSGYWKSDSLTFVSSKITKGWHATLQRYRQSYPTPDDMGRLTFEILSVRGLASETALVTGRYTLDRKSDRPTGLFTLIFKKIGNRWVIVYDHTG